MDTPLKAITLEALINLSTCRLMPIVINFKKTNQNPISLILVIKKKYFYEKLYSYSILFVSIFFFNVNFNAQEFSKLDKSPMDVSTYPASHRESNKIVKISYSRPQLKGRKMKDLVPSDKVWRTGANEACEITFYSDVNFGGKHQKGTYSLFTIPSSKEWTIILSSTLNVWGAYSYDKKEDIARVSAKVKNSKELIDAFPFPLKAKKWLLRCIWDGRILSHNRFLLKYPCKDQLIKHRKIICYR